MDNHRSGPVCNHSAVARGVLTRAHLGAIDMDLVLIVILVAEHSKSSATIRAILTTTLGRFSAPSNSQ